MRREILHDPLTFSNAKKLLSFRMLDGFESTSLNPYASTAFLDTINTVSVDDDSCSPPDHATRADICRYVSDTDACSGGGYLEWAAYVLCAENDASKWLIFVGAILFMSVLFLLLSTSADDFFTPNIAVIVDLLKISENVAGVTFLALGNGAPDVFSSIASVVSSANPKADLALGELLGGTMFVTLFVTATIVLARPLKAMFWSTMRDLTFLFITIGWLFFIFMFDVKVHVWQPVVLIGIYAIYVALVISSVYVSRKHRKEREEVSEAHHDEQGAPVHELGYDGVLHCESGLSLAIEDDAKKLGERNQSSDSGVVVNDLAIETVASLEELCSDEETQTPEIHNIQTFLYDIWAAIRPMEWHEFLQKRMFRKITTILTAPFYVVLRMTIPLAAVPWNKWMAIIHAVVCPAFFLVAIKKLTWAPANAPGLWLYGLCLSVPIIAFLAWFTEYRAEPRFYREICSPLGFIMSVAWIYAISNEVLGIVEMIGVVLGIPPTVLALTIIAWSNCIGDLTADISVARKGFARMAYSASVGGPVFNLLIGFGVPFTIAAIQGKTVTIAFNATYKIMLLFLTISVAYTASVMVLFRGHLRRWYAAGLVIIYVTFLVLVILAATNIIRW